MRTLARRDATWHHPFLMSPTPSHTPCWAAEQLSRLIYKKNLDQRTAATQIQAYGETRFTQSYLNRILTGEMYPSLQAAILIEEWSRARIRCTAWKKLSVPKRKARKRKYATPAE